MKDDGDGVENRKMCLASEDVTSGFETHFIIYVYFLCVSFIKTNNYCYSLIIACSRKDDCFYLCVCLSRMCHESLNIF